MIRRLFSRFRGGETVQECRQCGTSLDEDDEVCPNCGSEEIAVYEFRG